MKRKSYPLILFAAFLIFGKSISAQSPGPAFSVVVGVVKSSIVGESDSWKDPFGFQAGVIANLLSLSNEASFRAEANISMQGAKWEDDWGEGLKKGRTTLLYANLPLVLRYQFENRFFGEAGIQPGLLLSAKDKYDDVSYDYKEWVKKFDISIPFGVGYELENNIGIGLRVIMGITNINEGEDVSKDRNFVVALRGTYTFNK